jgi:hexosaminidase
MVFPRLPGIAEIGWTQSSQRNWTEYRLRLARHGERLRALGINYFPSKVVPW